MSGPDGDPIPILTNDARFAVSVPHALPIGRGRVTVPTDEALLERARDLLDKEGAAATLPWLIAESRVAFLQQSLLVPIAERDRWMLEATETERLRAGLRRRLDRQLELRAETEARLEDRIRDLIIQLDTVEQARNLAIENEGHLREQIQYLELNAARDITDQYEHRLVQRDRLVASLEMRLVDTEERLRTARAEIEAQEAQNMHLRDQQTQTATLRARIGRFEQGEGLAVMRDQIIEEVDRRVVVEQERDRLRDQLAAQTDPYVADATAQLRVVQRQLAEQRTATDRAIERSTDLEMILAVYRQENLRQEIPDQGTVTLEIAMQRLARSAMHHATSLERIINLLRGGGTLYGIVEQVGLDRDRPMDERRVALDAAAAWEALM